MSTSYHFFSISSISTKKKKHKKTFSYRECFSKPPKISRESLLDFCNSIKNLINFTLKTFPLLHPIFIFFFHSTFTIRLQHADARINCVYKNSSTHQKYNFVYNEFKTGLLYVQNEKECGQWKKTEIKDNTQTQTEN